MVAPLVAARVLTNPTVLRVGAGVITGVGITSLWNSVMNNGEDPVQNTTSSTSTAETQTYTSNTANTTNLNEIANDNRISNYSVQLPDYNIITNSPSSSISTSKKMSNTIDPNNSANTAQKSAAENTAATKANTEADAEGSSGSGLNTDTILKAALIAGVAYVIGELID